MLDAYALEPDANSGKLLFCLKDGRVPFTFHYIGMGRHPVWFRGAKARLSAAADTARDRPIVTMGPERALWE